MRDRADRVYNPLSVDELGRNAARALMGFPAEPLPPEETFEGAGVYTLHYTGDFPPYTDIDPDTPIYAGRADPRGRRQGRARASLFSAPLFERLRQHAGSIESATNLRLRDFSCRWLILDSVWIGLTEQVLIAEYQPIWNTIVDGFGNHAAGGGRLEQRRSLWDTLHPGREWAFRLRESQKTAEEVVAAIAEFRRARNK